MGVDISGRNPIHRTPKHEYPNWNEISDKEKDEWFEMDTKWHNENPGDYFRSNWWGWRPLLSLCIKVNTIYELNFNFDGWGHNDGAGLETQEECDKLSAALERFTGMIDFKDEDDWMGIHTGSWTTLDGRFVGEEINDKLNLVYEPGEVLRSSVVMEDGTVVTPAHKVYKSRIDEFIKFLKECGGFSIW